MLFEYSLENCFNTFPFSGGGIGSKLVLGLSNWPTAVKSDPNGILYIAEAGGRCVAVFNPNTMVYKRTAGFSNGYPRGNKLSL